VANDFFAIKAGARPFWDTYNTTIQGDNVEGDKQPDNSQQGVPAWLLVAGGLGAAALALWLGLRKAK
jgi:hypothetical protein